jgi:transcription-repair coupling factor (superfamily II helicase)
MCQAKAMDRLVCGDVGFGKTEVAMRAAFLATHNEKQVAVLVPTTLLAQQHFENFRDRFANFPIRVEVLSRFKSAKEQKEILAATAEGKVDILIGTHKLLQGSIKFEDLGLLIVDEEHRFGVRQKEKVKAMRSDVDILTLTATPIPRTLNMAMSGMRDLSIIATPPARRLAIKTFVREKADDVIKEAILREIKRGGQVYVLHNNVETIQHAAEEIEKLIPEARVTLAHGQMRERELERIMGDFYHQRFNVLVCTTIIETGIDVPTANTIIMDRADKLGLAQLHQLRGRVGRSHHQAYAYLLTPHPKALSKDAIKRLDAIASLEDLGAGFTLATHDLEIRGAGELLGDGQSGQIQSVGFTLYMEMLEQAVEALKEGKEPSLDDLLREQTEVELRLPALIPEDYIPDVNTRLSLYKRIASVVSNSELDELKVEIIDRFGSLPEATQTLLVSSEVKMLAASLKVKKLEAHGNGGYIEFEPTADINPMFLVSLLQKDPTGFALDGPTKIKFIKDLTERQVRIKYVIDLLNLFYENRI